MDSVKDNFKKLYTASSKLFFSKPGGALFLVAVIFFLPFLLIYNFFWSSPTFPQYLILHFSWNSYLIINLICFLIILLGIILYLIAIFKSIQAVDHAQPIAFKNVFPQGWKLLGGYLTVKGLYLLKVVLWSMVFVVPGIVLVLPALAGQVY